MKKLGDQGIQSDESPDVNDWISSDRVVFHRQHRVLKRRVGYVAERRARNNKAHNTALQWHQISDFVIEPVRVLDKGANDKFARRVVKIRNPQNDYCVETVAERRVFTSRGKFRVWLLSMGNFHFLGTKADLERIRSIIFDATVDEVRLKNVNGHPTGRSNVGDPFMRQ